MQKYGYDGLAAATVMAGFFLIILGLARMGDMIKFIPYPVTVGFTGGIAVIIFTTQIYDFLGLSISPVPEHIFSKWVAYFQNLTTMNFNELFLGVITVVITVLWPKVTRRLPGPLIAIIVSVVMVKMFHLSVDTIGTRFGNVAHTFPAPHFPLINTEIIIKLLSPALTIALLAGIESLLSAVVADGMTGRRHRSNMELIAQGVANICSPLFNGIPATGAIARTATNIKNGGQTPVAGIVHAVTVLLLFLFFGNLAALIPMATLAGILIVVAYNMSEWHLFVKLLKARKGDVVVLMATFLLTIFVDLTVAIEVGIVLAAFLFMHRVVALTKVKYVTSESEEDLNDPDSITKKDIPRGVEVFEINGPFFFGAADKFRDMLREIERKPKVMIVGLKYVPSIDATGLHALEDLFENARRDKTRLLIFGCSAGLLRMLRKMGFVEKIGLENIFPTIDLALEKARRLL